MIDISTHQGRIWFDHLHHWVPSMDEALTEYRAIGFSVIDLGVQSAGYRWAGAFLGLACFELFEVVDWERLRGAAPTLAARVERLLEQGGGVTKLFFGVPEMEAALGLLDRQGLERPALSRIDSGEHGIWTLATLEPEAPVQIVLSDCSLPPAERAAKLESLGVREPARRPGEILLGCPDPAGKAAWFGIRTGVAPEPLSGGRYRLPVPGGSLLLGPGRERVEAVSLDGSDGPEALVGGLRIF